MIGHSFDYFDCPNFSHSNCVSCNQYFGCLTIMNVMAITTVEIVIVIVAIVSHYILKFGFIFYLVVFPPSMLKNVCIFFTNMLSL